MIHWTPPFFCFVLSLLLLSTRSSRSFVALSSPRSPSPVPSLSHLVAWGVTVPLATCYPAEIMSNITDPTKLKTECPGPLTQLTVLFNNKLLDSVLLSLYPETVMMSCCTWDIDHTSTRPREVIPALWFSQSFLLFPLQGFWSFSSLIPRFWG